MDDASQDDRHLASFARRSFSPTDSSRRANLVHRPCRSRETDDADLKTALELLAGFQKHVDVILGLNLKEAMQVAEVLGLEFHGETEDGLRRGASSIRAALGIGSR